MSRTRAAVLLALVSCLLISQSPASSRLLKKCDAVKELRRSKVVDKSFIAHLVCVMQYDGNYNTSLVKGPGSKASFSYGVFQISSDKWCSRYRVGGECKKKCDDFANDDIQDDIVCADMIFRNEGLKHWPGWVKNCKNGKLPSLSDCKDQKDGDDSDDFSGNVDDRDNKDSDKDSDESTEDSEEDYDSKDESKSEELFDKQDKIADDVVDVLKFRQNVETIVQKLNHPLRLKIMKNKREYPTVPQGIP